MTAPGEISKNHFPSTKNPQPSTNNQLLLDPVNSPINPTADNTAPPINIHIA